MRPLTSYLICATPRCGSYLLCEALRNTGIAGRPDEFFYPDTAAVWRERWGATSDAEFLSRAIDAGSTPNGVFGAKVMWGYFDDFTRQLRRLPGASRRAPVPELLAAAFPNLSFVWITRRDKVRQAVSHWRAAQTNVWVWGGERQEAREPAFDFRQIDRLVRQNQEHDRAWQRFFAAHRISPFVVVYEQLAEAYETTATQILRFLNISVPDDLVFGERRMKRQADDLSESWVEQYHSAKRARKRWWLA